jgi:SnoaL-like domain
MENEVLLLERLYRQFNAREIESILKVLDKDVAWANGMEGGHIHGRDAVRDYWTRQWTVIDPTVEPTKFSRDADGKIIVEVHQTVRDLGGKLLADRIVGHIFCVLNGMVQRFDIRDP